MARFCGGAAFERWLQRLRWVSRCVMRPLMRSLKIFLKSDQITNNMPRVGKAVDDQPRVAARLVPVPCSRAY